MSYSSQGASGALFSQLYRVLPGRSLSMVPNGPGLYAFTADGKLYFGMSLTLRKRVPKSQREQKFRGVVYFLPMEPCPHLSAEELRTVLLQIEGVCISALHTITWGHQFPLLLTNKERAVSLPSQAWAPDQPREMTLGIEVAKTILEDAGVPPRYCNLPPEEKIQSLRNQDLIAGFEALAFRHLNPFRPEFKPSSKAFSEVTIFQKHLAACPGAEGFLKSKSAGTRPRTAAKAARTSSGGPSSCDLSAISLPALYLRPVPIIDR